MASTAKCGCAVVLLCVLHLVLNVAAASQFDIQREHLMMYDPRMPTRLPRELPHSNIQLQQQQHMQQQIQHYAAIAAQQRRRQHRSGRSWRHKRPQRAGATAFERRLQETASRASTPLGKRNFNFDNLPPSSCYHVEQQMVQLIAEFDCSSPAVLGYGTPEAFEANVCAAALKQLQQPSSNSNADYNVEDSARAECSTAQSCAGQPADGLSSETYLMRLSLYLPYTTCAVALQAFADELEANPHALLQSDQQLVQAVTSMTHVSIPEPRAAAISAAIQSSRNELLRAVSISADEAEHLGEVGGMVDEDTQQPSDWLWDPYLSAYNLDLDVSLGIWITAVCVFGMGLLTLGMMTLHRGCLVLARNRAEQRLVAQATANAAEAAAEEAEARGPRESAASDAAASDASSDEASPESARSSAGLLREQ